MIIAGKTTFVMPCYSWPVPASTVPNRALEGRACDEYLVLVHLQLEMRDVLLSRV